MFEKEILHISIKDRVTDNLKNTEIKLSYVFFSFLTFVLLSKQVNPRAKSTVKHRVSPCQLHIYVLDWKKEMNFERTTINFTYHMIILYVIFFVCVRRQLANNTHTTLQYFILKLPKTSDHIHSRSVS